MDSLEEFEIYKATKNAMTKNNILNDQMNFGSNNLFDTAIRLNDKYSQSWGSRSTACMHASAPSDSIVTFLFVYILFKRFYIF